MESKLLFRKAVLRLKDPVSGFTHFIGALLSCVGLVFLMWKTSHPLKPWHFTTCTVFGVGMILLYTTSTLYHWLNLSEKGSANLRKLDHIMIFVLIASTYTPFCLIAFKGSFGWSLFASVWSIAVLGAVFKIFWIHAPRWVSAGVYVCMGWIALVGIGPIVRVLEPGAVFWLLTGGVLYSIGGLVYACRRPDPFPKLLGFHEIFHIFVMLGSFSHFWVIYRYVTGLS